MQDFGAIAVTMPQVVSPSVSRPSYGVGRVVIRDARGRRRVVHARIRNPYDPSLEGLGFSWRIGGSIGKVLGNVQRAATKAVKDTGHVAGNVITSNVGRAVIGGALAVTGVGLPLAAAIGAGSQALGGAIKSGGGLKEAVRGTYQGAIIGAGSSLVGTGGRALLSKIQDLRTPNVSTVAQAMNDKAAADASANDASVANTAASLLPVPNAAPGIPDQSGLAPVAPTITSVLPPPPMATVAADNANALDSAAVAAKGVANQARSSADQAMDNARNAKTPADRSKWLKTAAQHTQNADDANSSWMDFIKGAAQQRILGQQIQEQAQPTGFPVTPATPSSAIDQTAQEAAQPQQAGIGAMFSNPIALAALGGIAILLITQNRRGR